jgi:hypothetical protein
LKEEALALTLWRTRFGRGDGRVVRHRGMDGCARVWAGFSWLGVNSYRGFLWMR